jgi:REP element-mobilizing transposase RayT
MSQSLSNILIHLVFSTKNRLGLIPPRLEEELWQYLAGTCNVLRCPPHRVGGDADHIHIACTLARTVAVSELVEEVKSSSSKWMKDKGVPDFWWQNGYGAFSVGQSQLEDLVAYIQGQKEHHRGASFQDEYRQFLRRYQIPYDERYVWD